MLSKSDIKKMTAAFVGAVTMAVALPTALYANMPVKADEPSEISELPDPTYMTTTVPFSVYDTEMFENYYSVNDVALVGSTIEMDTKDVPFVMFPDEMTFVEEGNVREVKAEKLKDGKRKWKGEFIEFTVEKDSTVAVVTALKKGMTHCLIGWGEDMPYADGVIYKNNTFLHVDVMEKAEYDEYLEELNTPDPTIQPTTAIGGYYEDPTEESTYDSFDFYEAIGSPKSDLIVGEKTVIEVNDPTIDPSIRFRDYDGFDCKYEPESETSKFFDVKKIGDRKFEITAKSEGSALLCMGSDKKGYCHFTAEQLRMNLENYQSMYMDGTEAEKSIEIDLSEGWDYLGKYSWTNTYVPVDVNKIVSAETAEWVALDEFERYGYYKKAEPEVAKIEPTEKKGVYRITALKEGCQILLFTEENGKTWIDYVYVTTHAAVEAEEEYRRQHPTEACVGTTLPVDEASTVHGVCVYLYINGKADEKEIVFDLSEELGYESENGWVAPDAENIVSVDIENNTADKPCVSVEATDKKGVYKIKALAEGTVDVFFTEKSGRKWIAAIDVQRRYAQGENIPGTTVPYTYSAVATAGYSAMLGDVNNDNQVTLADSLAILQYLANSNKYGLSDRMLLNADIVDRGEGVTAQDALAIQKIDAKALKESDLPIKSSKL